MFIRVHVMPINHNNYKSSKLGIQYCDLGHKVERNDKKLTKNLVQGLPQ